MIRTETKERLIGADWNPKAYRNTGKMLYFGEDISPENMQLLREGEIFTLLDEAGNPFSNVLMDSYDTIREAPIHLTKPGTEMP